MSLVTEILKKIGPYAGLKAEPPDLGSQGYNPPLVQFTGWGWNRYRGKIDYRSEVGDLDLNSLVMAVVNFTSIRIPEAKPAVDVKGEKDFEHPVAKLIRRPNPYHIWANYAAAIAMSWWISGNVYLYKLRKTITGEVSELWYLPHHLVSPRWPNDKRSPDVIEWAKDHDEDVANLSSFLSHFEFRVPGKQPILYPANDVIHLKRGVDLNTPQLGLGAFESLYKELVGDDKMALYTAAIMSNMGLQVPIISPKDKTVSILEPDAQHMKQLWKQKTTGESAGEAVILTEPVDLEKFGFAPSELDMSKLRLIIEARVCAVCNISPAALQLMVGVENGTSYASSSQARQQGYEEVIIPIQNVWAEEFTWQLLREFQEDGDVVFDVDNVRVLQEDRDALYKRESEALRVGGITINEYLTAIGKQQVPEGDIYLIPRTSLPATIDTLKQLADAPGALSPAMPAEQSIGNDQAIPAKLADIDRMFESLESQMEEFIANNA